MRATKQLCGVLLAFVALTLCQPASRAGAFLRTVIADGVGKLADGPPTFADPVVFWATVPDCGGGPRAPRGGDPGDELLPFQINRAGLEVGGVRTLYEINPTRPVATCNPHRLLSNIFVTDSEVFFVDNQGPDGHAALWKRSRNSVPTDGSQMLVDMGTQTVSADILVFGVSVIMIRRNSNIFVVPNVIVQYHKDTGELLNGSIDAGDEGSLSTLRYDGRYLYWLKNGTLRRNDTTNGNLVDALPGQLIEKYVVYGYEEQCGPKGCEFLSRILFSRGGQMFEAETLNNQVFPVYTSAEPTAAIVDVERGSVDYFFIELRPRGGGFEEDTYRFYRLGVGNTVPDLILGPITDNPLGYEGFRSDFVWLYFRDVAHNRLLKLSVDELAIPTVDLRATGLEVTQGLQNRNNDLRLIANKRTFVRFYARSGSGAAVPSAGAALFGSNDFGFLGRLDPVNTGKTISVRPDPSRGDLNQSFQFELPLYWTTGGRLSLSATVNPDDLLIDDVDIDDSAALDVDFSTNERLLVIYYNWSYDLGGTRYTPSATDVANSRARMRRLYPIGEAGDAFESPGLHTVVLDMVDNGLTSQVDRTNADCVKRYKKADDRNLCASDYVHGRMMALRQNSGIAPGAVSYGNIAQAPAPMGLSYFTRGYANGQFASGPSTDANYASHEVGHVLQRPHPLPGALSCGHSPDDAGYPHNGARIDTIPSDAEARFQGLNFTDGNPATLTLLDAATTYDTMSYCSPNWISDYTTEHMYNYLISDTRPRAVRRAVRGAIVGDWLIASGTMTPGDKEGGFTVVQRTTSVMDASPPEGNGFTLRMRNSAGGVLTSHPFAASPVEDAPGKVAFNFVVPFAPGTAELRVVEDATQRVLATLAVSPSSPLVSDVQLPGAPDPVDGIVTVTWNASDADGDALTFDIFATRDNGMSYTPLHLGISGRSVALDTAALGGGSARLRVMASDGVNTAVADSPPFNAADRTPKVVIASPGDGIHVAWRQLVTLQADVSDLQDDFIPNQEIYWLSSRIGGVFATGRIVQTDQLPVGENILEVQAVNSLNRIGSATVTVFVDDVLIGPERKLTVAPQSIGWHVGAEETTPQSVTLAVTSGGKENSAFDVSSNAPWLLIDSQMAISNVAAPQSFTIIGNPANLPAGITSRAALTVTNRGDPSDVIVIPVELSRGNVFDHTGGEPQGVCAGDCDGNGSVGIAELIRGVNIALGNVALSECTAFDRNDDGQVNISELISAVNAALFGC